MDEELSEMQRRMQARGQRFLQKSRRRTKDRFALTAIVVGVSFGVAFLWHQVGPSKPGTEHAASHVGPDQESMAQSEPSQATPASRPP